MYTVETLIVDMLNVLYGFYVEVIALVLHLRIMLLFRQHILNLSDCLACTINMVQRNQRKPCQKKTGIN